MSDTYRGMHGKTANSELIQSLREKPRMGVDSTSPEQREHVARLRIPRKAPSGKVSVGNGRKTVYYLWGDDRRAVRRLIEEYPDYFREIFSGEAGQTNRISSSWSGEMVRLAKEEWKLYQATEES